MSHRVDWYVTGVWLAVFIGSWACFAAIVWLIGWLT